MNHCNRPSHKHGKDRHGNQRYKCPVCGTTYTDNPTPGKPGRKPIGDKSMTPAEQKRRRRKQIKEDSGSS